jgi:hypothetical protein
VSEIRSRKVRKILRLEARAQRLLARYDRAMRKVEPARARAEALLREVRAIEYTLTGSQLGELRRSRGRRP